MGLRSLDETKDQLTFAPNQRSRFATQCAIPTEHIHLEGYDVVFDVSFIWVKNLIPAHEMREPPIIFLTVEQVGDFCNKFV